LANAIAQELYDNKRATSFHDIICKKGLKVKDTREICKFIKKKHPMDSTINMRNARRVVCKMPLILDTYNHLSEN
jgi:hypothetical protein